ncbi:50S ribosomal protein L25 [Candidatus Uhrbacteria bacterium CG_4_9_14_3_um_filter_50_9]|uniref:Large ribosomal subunit protein bL25 n=1 Tax=Candidatus Uhrbacteria bacterium CG_4_9_14_3_um_filter_50_9 TaxID=1975035 RepID=A0A2M7XCT7_9BACT|nr:MAG: 50S ribosomal protein L25 [Candidatus Uhrbacteria bacterium CG_4_9_14_3_um_filter_50_9]
MSINTLQASTRELTGRKTNALRAEGKVPAVVYGTDTEPQNIVVDRNTFIKMYKTAGESSIVELEVDGKISLHVLIQDYQQDALTDDVTHIDFRSIDMNKVIDAVVDLVLVGESAAVKALGGTLVHSRDSVTIHCLPSQLVRDFKVDLSKLVTFDDVFRISDLDVPEGVTVVDDANLTIAVVTPPRTEAEMAALEDAVEENIGAVEGAAEKTPEGEEVAKGEKTEKSA